MKKTVKKHVAEAALVSFTFASVLPGGAAFAAADVTDVNGHWAEQAIHDWMERGYIGGYEDNTFRPDQTITRAEFVKLVNKTIDADQTATIAFSDVSDSDWFAGEVALALGEGYVSGFEDGTFRPDQPVTRAQAAAFLAKALKLTGDADAVADMTDSAAIPDWAAGAIGAVVDKGYMGGYEDGTFRPNRPLTRAEAVSMLNRVLNDDGNEDTKPPVVIGGGGGSSSGGSSGGGGSVTRYTVTFDSQGGSDVASVTVKRGDKLTRPADPTRTGYIFGGWYTDKDCTTAWNFENDTVREATTLYAKWVIKDAILNPSITNWYGDNNEYLDTSVTIDFDKVAKDDITKITFELLKDEKVIGDAVSEGKNLETLFAECEQYWVGGATGQQVLSNAFKNRVEKEDNGYWVRSACDIDARDKVQPNGLRVMMETKDGTVYQTKGEFTVTPVTDATDLLSPSVTSWYEIAGKNYLDTSVKIDFNTIKITDITKITFKLLKDNDELGTAVSSGDELVNLFRDCNQYWDKFDGDDGWKSTTGTRDLSCAFKYRAQNDNVNDNQYWDRSAFKVDAYSELQPNKLQVVIETADQTYTTEGTFNVVPSTTNSSVLIPSMTSWYPIGGENYLDTSVNIDFDKIDIESIEEIKFEVFDDTDLVGSAVSSGDELVNLFRDCDQYWNQGAGDDGWKDTTGKWPLSCAFKYRAQDDDVNDNQYWDRSAFKVDAYSVDQPTKLSVAVKTTEGEYRTTGDFTVAPLEKSEVVTMPTVTNWYKYDGEDYLDTGVKIDFDNIKIEDVSKITFALLQDDKVIGTAVSEGENLVSLFRDCNQYWNNVSGDDGWKSTTGTRDLSCAFKNRTEEQDNGFWVRSACDIDAYKADKQPNGLRVLVTTKDGVVRQTESDFMVTPQTDATGILVPSITSWYVYEDEHYLDTSVAIDFDKIDINAVEEIIFELEQDGVSVAKAVSSKDDSTLPTLFEECAPYWNDVDWTKTTGVQTLSNAFKNDTVESSDCWVRTGNLDASTEGVYTLTVVIKTVDAEYIVALKDFSVAGVTTISAAQPIAATEILPAIEESVPAEELQPAEEVTDAVEATEEE